MTKIAYITRRFQPERLAVIKKADEIIESYQARGFDLTLRQTFYKFVANNLFPESWIDPVYNAKHGLAPNTKNTEKNYNRLGSILNDARLAGLISWDAIVDRTRHVRSLAHWTSPKDLIDSAARQYRIDRWANQKNRVEVWIEKDALIDVVARPCTKFDVPYFSCRGYVSQSAQWRAAQRLLGYIEGGQTPIVLHLGDHDPSGVDMTRDMADRLELFGVPRETMRRIALTMEQIDELQPPPDPAKATDSRSPKYVERFGPESWELDALEPEYLMDLVETEIKKFRSWKVWKKRRDREKRERAALRKAADNISI